MRSRVARSTKRILLVRPRSQNERFGLGPFFRVEPLGLEYIAAALLEAGHSVRITDERFAQPLQRQVSEFKPDIVGISCLHTVDIPTSLAACTTAKRALPQTTVVMGGHVVALYPEPFLEPDVDALCAVDGEIAFLEFVNAHLNGRPEVCQPGFRIRVSEGRGSGQFNYTPWTGALDELKTVPLPARHLVDEFRAEYLCVHKQPVWAVETARGCPYRCSFCSTSLRYDHRHRLRETPAVVADFESAGANLFIVNDLFFSPSSHSAELARALKLRDIRKSWILVQTRLDTIAKHPQLLEQWRPIAGNIDLFCGFEAPTDAQLSELNKDMTADAIEEGVRIARRYGYGVTGNFVIDPDWDEGDFEKLWSMVRQAKTDTARLYGSDSAPRNPAVFGFGEPNRGLGLVKMGHAPRPV